MSGISIALVLLACTCLLAVVFIWSGENIHQRVSGVRTTRDRLANALACIGVSLLFVVGVIEYDAAPVAYYSNKALVQTGKKVCAFVDTKEGKKPCTAFSGDELRNMEEAWSE